MAAAASPFRPDLLKDHSALVTGGGSGICLEIARQLGLHGAQVTIMGRRSKLLDQAVAKLKEEGIKAFSAPGDEEVERAVAAAAASMGGIDILVNGAAGNFLATAEGLRPGGFRTVMEIDACGTFNMCHAAHAHLKVQNPEP
ncbi:hypothetical protein T484DRAFT_1848024 [Baffinella frigidus]|nr:hypothetical protein T484DRAFT_1848024 [Cryptophyta sp. CCMP2293]